MYRLAVLLFSGLILLILMPSSDQSLSANVNARYGEDGAIIGRTCTDLDGNQLCQGPDEARDNVRVCLEESEGSYSDCGLTEYQEYEFDSRTPGVEYVASVDTTQEVLASYELVSIQCSRHPDVVRSCTTEIEDERGIAYITLEEGEAVYVNFNFQPVSVPTRTPTRTPVPTNTPTATEQATVVQIFMPVALSP